MTDEVKKVSANRVKKEQIVANLSEKIGKAKAIVFTNYQGLTHKQIEELKKAIKPAEGEFVVAKNSLVLRSLSEKKLPVSDEKKLDGPTGTLLMYGDIVAPLKALAKTIKELNLPNIKFGILESKEITAEEVTKISALPSREVLLAQLVGGLKSPIFGLHRALNWNLQKFVLTLNAIAQNKPAVAASTTPQPEIKTESITEAVVEVKAEEETPAQAQTEDNQEETKTSEGGEN